VTGTWETLRSSHRAPRLIGQSGPADPAPATLYGNESHIQ
jgi:hypothetical protein